MKKNILWIVVACIWGIVVVSCQNLDEPTPQAPKLHVYEAENVTSTTAYLRNESYYKGSLKGTYSYLLSVDENFQVSSVYSASFNSGSTIYGLKPNTTYYYKMTGSYGGVTISSEVKSFTTQQGLSIAKLTYTDWDGTVREVDANMSPLGITAVSDNIRYYNWKIVYENGEWKIPDELLEMNIDRCAIYTPYIDKGFLKEDELGWLQMATYKNAYKDEKDYLTGYMEPGVSQSISLNLSHSLARVRFHFTMAEDCTEEQLAVSDVMLKQNASSKIIPTIFYYSLFGKITNVSEFSDIYFGTGFELVKNNQAYRQADVTFYSGSTRNSGTVQIQLNLSNGTTCSVPLELKVDDWKSGNTYDYNIVYTQTGLTISDVSVNE